MKKILFCLLLFFSAVYVFAELPVPPEFRPKVPGQENFRPEPHNPKRNYRNFHGKRFINEDREFKAVVIRSFDISDVFLIEVFFNCPIESNSLQSECIKINDMPVDLNQLRFSKNRNSIRMVFPKETFNKGEVTFSFELRKIKAINGNEIIPVTFNNCQFSSEYRFSEREKEWKKF